MPKTRTEVIAEAHRRINVLSVDENPSQDMVAYGGAAADSLFEEVNGQPYNMGFTWDLSAIPEAAFRPFAWILGVDLAIHYAVSAEPRSRAMQRLSAYAFPDDREDRRDIDEDGAISDDEALAGKQALFY